MPLRQAPSAFHSADSDSPIPGPDLGPVGFGGESGPGPVPDLPGPGIGGRPADSGPRPDFRPGPAGLWSRFCKIGGRLDYLGTRDTHSLSEAGVVFFFGKHIL